MIPVELGDGSTVMRRQWCFEFPDLKDCRAAFEDAVGQYVDWGAEGDERDGDGSRENSDAGDNGAAF